MGLSAISARGCTRSFDRKETISLNRGICGLCKLILCGCEVDILSFLLRLRSLFGLYRGLGFAGLQNLINISPHQFCGVLVALMRVEQ